MVFDGDRKIKKLRWNNGNSSCYPPVDRESSDWKNGISDIKLLCELCKVKIVNAPGEGEAECAYLFENGKVDYVFTSDSDVLMFGVTRIIKYAPKSIDLTLKSANSNSKSSKNEMKVSMKIPKNSKALDRYISVIRLPESDKSHFSKESFILYALLRGGDHHFGSANIGSKLAEGLSFPKERFARDLLQIYKNNLEMARDDYKRCTDTRGMSLPELCSIEREMRDDILNEMLTELETNKSGYFSRKMSSNVNMTISNLLECLNEEIITYYLYPGNSSLIQWLKEKYEEVEIFAEEAAKAHVFFSDEDIFRFDPAPGGGYPSQLRRLNRFWQANIKALWKITYVNYHWSAETFLKAIIPSFFPCVIFLDFPVFTVKSKRRYNQDGSSLFFNPNLISNTLNPLDTSEHHPDALPTEISQFINFSRPEFYNVSLKPVDFFTSLKIPIDLTFFEEWGSNLKGDIEELLSKAMTLQISGHLLKRCKYDYLARFAEKEKNNENGNTTNLNSNVISEAEVSIEDTVATPAKKSETFSKFEQLKRPITSLLPSKATKRGSGSLTSQKLKQSITKDQTSITSFFSTSHVASRSNSNAKAQTSITSFFSVSHDSLQTNSAKAPTLITKTVSDNEDTLKQHISLKGNTPQSSKKRKLGIGSKSEIKEDVALEQTRKRFRMSNDDKNEQFVAKKFSSLPLVSKPPLTEDSSKVQKFPSVPEETNEGLEIDSDEEFWKSMEDTLSRMSGTASNVNSSGYYSVVESSIKKENNNIKVESSRPSSKRKVRQDNDANDDTDADTDTE